MSLNSEKWCELCEQKDKLFNELKILITESDIYEAFEAESNRSALKIFRLNHEKRTIANKAEILRNAKKVFIKKILKGALLCGAIITGMIFGTFIMSAIIDLAIVATLPLILSMIGIATLGGAVFYTLFGLSTYIKDTKNARKLSRNKTIDSIDIELEKEQKLKDVYDSKLVGVEKKAIDANITYKKIFYEEVIKEFYGLNTNDSTQISDQIPNETEISNNTGDEVTLKRVSK